MTAATVLERNQPTQAGSMARVALLSRQGQPPAPWTRRGMSVARLSSPTLDRLLASAPDAVVVDYAAGPGRYVADCWRLHDLLRVPLIVVAEGANSRDVAAFFERGADDVVAEPADGPLLAARVAAVLRRTRGRTAERLPELLRFSGADVDLARRQALRDGNAASLSRTEFSLLEALLRAGGRACSHTELVTRVWGIECASATHYLRLYIRYLRQKLELDPMRPRNILNVRGVGYRLVLDCAAGAADELCDLPDFKQAMAG